MTPGIWIAVIIFSFLIGFWCRDKIERIEIGSLRREKKAHDEYLHFLERECVITQKGSEYCTTVDKEDRTLCSECEDGC